MPTRICLYGSPNSGKTTLAYDLCSALKKEGKCVELIPEKIKSDAYKNKMPDGYLNFKYQVEQIEQEYDFLSRGKVDAVVCESPLLLGFFYIKTHGLAGAKAIEFLAAEHELKYPTYHILLKRNPDFKYQSKGRFESQKEAELLEYKIFADVTNFLNTYVKTKHCLRTLDAGNESQLKELVSFLKGKI